MTRRTHLQNSARQRSLIASTAARILAESGGQDYAQAKRKALHSLGLAENTPLPENAEVEAELRIYQSLYQDAEQSQRIASLRQKASEMMVILQNFKPYLTGSVLEGSAGRFAEIDLQLFPDSAKEVEIFLLNQRIEYTHSEPRSARAEAVLTLENDGAVINLVIYPAHDERVNFKNRDGKVRQRLRLDGLLKLLSAARPES